MYKKRGWLVLFVLLAGCASAPGVDFTAFQPCPDTPNCVSSEDSHADHHVKRMALAIPAATAMQRVAAAVKTLPRVTLIKVDDSYLHAECRSRIFRFVDDLELRLNADNTLSIRSASRVGYSDLGVNRKRVATVRALLLKQGLIQPSAPGG